MKKFIHVEQPKLEDEFFLTWYSLEDEDIVGEEQVALTEKQLREWFAVEEHEGHIDGYIISEDQVELIQPYVKHKIDIEKYEHVIEHLT